MEKICFEEIYQSFQPKVHRFLVGVAGVNQAEDLTQEVFIKIEKGLEGFKGESQLSTWVYRIATNTALDYLRKPKQHFLDSTKIGNIVENAASIKANLVERNKRPLEEKLILDEMNQCIRSFVQKLPENYRIILILKEFEGLKSQEIAEILQLSLDTVKIRLHRARARLKKELEKGCKVNALTCEPKCDS